MVESSCVVFNTSAKSVVRQLESVQRRFTRLLWYRTSPHTAVPDYVSRCLHFSLPSLEYRRCIRDLCFMHRIVLGKSAIVSFYKFSASRTRGALRKVVVPRSKLQLRTNSFHCRSAKLYRLLPPRVTSAPSVKAFKPRLTQLDSDFFIFLMLNTVVVPDCVNED